MNEEYVKDWNIVEWKVVKVISNERYPNLLVVKTPTEVILISTEDKPILLKVISVQTTQFDIAFSPYSLVAFFWGSETDMRIEEYSLTDLTTLVEIKEFEMYDY